MIAAAYQPIERPRQSHSQARIPLDRFLLRLSGSLETSLLRSMSTAHAWTSWTHARARLTVRTEAVKALDRRQRGGEVEERRFLSKDVSMATQANKEVKQKDNGEKQAAGRGAATFIQQKQTNLHPPGLDPRPGPGP